jgi:sugar phosphate isomerase/epimerase
MASEANIKLGVSLYSYTNEFYERKLSFEDCLKHTQQLGATGIEIVASQMIEGYPWPTAKTIGRYRELFAKHGLEPVAYGASVDRGLRSDRDLTESELLAGLTDDIRNAALLGCSIVRTQFLLSPEVLERAQDVAAAYKVKVGIELHNPSTPRSPEIAEYTRMFERVKSPWIGFVLDFGTYQERPDKFARDSFLEKGVRPEVFDMITEGVEKALPKEEVASKLKTMQPIGPEFGALEFCYTRYKPSNFDELQEILPYINHCHGKFYYVNEEYVDPAIPYGAVISVLKKGGFKGYIMSEYEGHMFGDRGDVVELLRRHLTMERRMLAL